MPVHSNLIYIQHKIMQRSLLTVFIHVETSHTLTSKFTNKIIYISSI